MRGGAVIAAVLAACGSPEPRPLPGATTNKALARPVATACGMEVAYNDRVELRYRYTNDAFGRVERARGAAVRGGPEHVIDFEYDHLDHMTRRRDTYAGAVDEIVANYDTPGDLLEYTMTFGGQTVRYQLFDYTELGHPLRQVVSQPGEREVVTTMEYDALGRIVRAADDTGLVTTYAYDEAARTIVATGSDGVVNTVTFDDQNRMLSEILTGAGEAASYEDTYVWAGDRLETVTHTTIEAVEQQRFLYRCQ